MSGQKEKFLTIKNPTLFFQYWVVCKKKINVIEVLSTFTLTSVLQMFGIIHPGGYASTKQSSEIIVNNMHMYQVYSEHLPGQYPYLESIKSGVKVVIQSSPPQCQE